MLSSAAISEYDGRAVSVATMHGKERAFGRPLLRHLGAALCVASGIDTDALGTFTGEVRRVQPPKATAIAKARMGMAATGLPLGVASEGSFAPHPALFFAPADHEVVAFVDEANGFELCESVITLRTNFAHLDVTRDADVGAFLRHVGFPRHGLIVRPADEGSPPVAKGITDREQLVRALVEAVARSPTSMARIETDMRAHFNPTRMAVIRAAATRLARRLATACPSCYAPGWGRVETQAGLPCRWCSTPTALTLTLLEGCVACDMRVRRPRPDGRRFADPGDCPSCNP